MSAVKLRSREQVREEFLKTGVSIADWAREHKFKYSQVVDVLRADRQCRRGNSHKIAVLLGIKDGVITPPHLRGPIIQAYADTNGLPPNNK